MRLPQALHSNASCACFCVQSHAGLEYTKLQSMGGAAQACRSVHCWLADALPAGASWPAVWSSVATMHLLQGRQHRLLSRTVVHAEICLQFRFHKAEP